MQLRGRVVLFLAPAVCAGCVVSRLSPPELVAENAIGEAVARFAVSECDSVLASYREGGLTISETLWALNGLSNLGCRVILKGSAQWHEERAR